MQRISVADLPRVRTILGVLSRHGFGRMLVSVGLGEHLPEGGEGSGSDAPWPRRVRDALVELGPTFVKLGQILSVRPDVVPVALAQELQSLQDRVPPVGFDAVRRVVEEDLGRPIEEAFPEFSPEPLAAASIAQVHRARLPDGTPVAVKVRRPDIVPLIAADLRILRTLARLIEGRLDLPGVYTPVGIVNEFEAALTQELDFHREAQNAERFRASLAQTHPEIGVPRVFSDRSTLQVLVLELFEGDPVSALTAADARSGPVCRSLLEASFTQVFVNGLFHGDPHPGNLLVLPGGRLGYLDFGLVGVITGEVREVVSSLFLAIVFKDADAFVMAVMRAGASRGPVDVRAFRSDVEHLMARFHGASLATVSERANLLEFLDVAMRHGLVLPREYAILARAAALVYGLTHALLPDADIVAEVRPLAERLLARTLSPEHMAEEAARTLFQARASLSHVPLQVTHLLGELEADRFVVRVRDLDAEAARAEIRRAGVRIAAALSGAALGVSGAILLAPAEGRVAGVPLVRVLGVVLVLASAWVWTLVLATTHLPPLVQRTSHRISGLARFLFDAFRSRKG
ncbi:MAG: AarF/ABC1/UbiB kinase family protein [Deltaproteobacteria bacterium]|nr:AarF/ABC1/UbiB kinase family protein [Deltaproteobacteria bacterium]